MTLAGDLPSPLVSTTSPDSSYPYLPSQDVDCTFTDIERPGRLRSRPVLCRPPSEPCTRLRPRRSSTIFRHRFDEAYKGVDKDVLRLDDMDLLSHQNTMWTVLPIAFALLPAMVGALVPNGSAIISDVMLLGLAAVFLYWSVTQPWLWYHAAQEILVKEESDLDSASMRTSDFEPSTRSPTPTSTRDKNQTDDARDIEPKNKSLSDRVSSLQLSQGGASGRRRALSELRAHEMMALTACFLCPAIGAYMLHAMRNQLSRPSESLISNCNLIIFVLAAEIQPVSHLIKLVQSRTLRLQRMVHANPYQRPRPCALAQIEDLVQRLEIIEDRLPTDDVSSKLVVEAEVEDAFKAKKAQVTRDVRDMMQPELDALNRAMRRYEKKAMLLAYQTEARLVNIDARLKDAVALANAAAKKSTEQQASFLEWVLDLSLWIIMHPFQSAYVLATLPMRLAMLLFREEDTPPQICDRSSKVRQRDKPSWQRDSYPHPIPFSGIKAVTG